MRTVLITGANKSIGFESAKLLAKQGYHVYLGARDLAKGEEAAAKLKAEGLANIEAIQIDVTDKASIEAAQQTISEKGGSLDVLINNAGILGGYEQSAQTVDTSVIREVFDTNFFGVIDVTQAFLSLLKKSAQPVIVNVTSGLGSLTEHSDPNSKFYHVKTAAYGPSKTALNAYTVVLAYELRDTNFKVNVVDPGYTSTDFNNNSGPFKVEDSAAFVLSYATLGEDGPTGKYFSHENPDGDHEFPW